MCTPKDYSQPYDRLRDDCPVKAAIDVIRRRWKPSILFELCQGTKRFCDLQAALPGITAQVLTVQLRQLEADGVVARTVYAEVPARVEDVAICEGHGSGLQPLTDGGPITWVWRPRLVWSAPSALG